MTSKYLDQDGLTYFWSKIKQYIDTGTLPGGDDGPSIGTKSTTPASASGSIAFSGLSGEPTSFIIMSKANLATGASPYKVAAVLFDGTDLHGDIITNTSNAQMTYDGSNFSKSYSNGTLTVSCSSANFQNNEYDLVYTYGESSNIDTKNVQVGSGATSISFTGLEDEPTFWAIIFKSNFSTSSGYQRVISVANDGTSIYGLAMGSGAVAATSWTANYNNGTLTIQSSGTNNGGYFHQPGYYELVYSYGGSSSGGSETSEETDPIFTASPAYGISSSDITAWNAKQAALVSGTNIKTINNQSILGSGNISISGGSGSSGISLSDVYPVGSIYMSVNSTDPGTLFGGTWQRIQDMFLLAAGSTYSAGDTGGEASHKLTEDETAVRAHTHGFTQPTISNHRHSISSDHTYNVTSSSAQSFSTNNYKIGSSGTTYNGFIRNTGTNALVRDSNYTQYEQPTASGGAVGARAYGSNDGESSVSAHNNMPPYLAVYVWKRTA